ncbi:ABC transporter ATP-binding protein [Devosia sp. 2618]|uniref:ABC transporter ATP-binding protein n=1 Tax=Devosia sp. 2618 TaxID=3156454 RepID=UPI0033963158
MTAEHQMETLLEMQGIQHIFGRHEDWVDKGVRLLRGKRKPPARVRALNGVDLSLRRGEVLGIAGESGCGKSTLGRAMVGLMRPSNGTVTYRGEPVMRSRRPRHLKLQMIFQDSGSVLNPRLQVKDLIGEGPLLHGLVSRRELKDFVAAQLETVGMPADAMSRYPHQFSGGQRQRINIARVLALQPETIVCDESVAALDVSIQAQILNLFMDLKDKFGLTYAFISHDLGVLRHISDRIMVMYLGRVVEEGPAAEVFANPRHPYTRALLENAPKLSRRNQVFLPVPGEVPSPLNMPSGCAFHTRCGMHRPECAGRVPSLIGAPGTHRHACPVVGVAA